MARFLIIRNNEVVDEIDRNPGSVTTIPPSDDVTSMIDADQMLDKVRTLAGNAELTEAEMIALLGFTDARPT